MRNSSKGLAGRTVRRARCAAMVVAGLALSIGVAACGSSGGGDGSKTVSMGFLYDIASANVWTMEECLKPKGVTLKLNNFQQFADVQRAFQSGDVDIAVMGYQNLAQMIGTGFDAFKLVAGVSTRGEHISIRPGVEIRTWRDYEGKKVGIPPNSFVDMLFRADAKANGVDLDEIEFVSFPGAGPAMLAALKSGAIDVMVAWETNNAQAKVQGIGDYSPITLQEGATGNATSAMYASDRLIGSSPRTVQAVVDCLVERTEALSRDRDAWLKAAVDKTGVDPDVARVAFDKADLDERLYRDSAKTIVKIFADAGLVDDVTDQMDGLFDYSFLEKATGESAAQLGEGRTEGGGS